jgi:hypothetical protein
MRKPIDTIAFHLAIENIESPYSWQAYMAALTARHHNPDSRIFLGSDSATLKCLREGAHPILSIVEVLDLGELAEESAVIRSRIAKIRTAGKIDSSVLLLDCDTAIMRPLPDIGFDGCAIAAGYDAHVLAGKAVFPDFLVSHFQKLCWEYPTDRYFNSGVIWAAGRESRGNFFEEWERAYQAFCKSGAQIDQGAFNHVIDSGSFKVGLLEKEWNSFVSASEKVRKSAIILHFFSSSYGYEESNYKKIVDDLQAGRIRSAEQVMESLTAKPPLYYGHTIQRCVDAGDWRSVLSLILKKIFRSHQ